MGLELSPKLTQNQKFLKISYISYTRTTNLLYLLAISGEGLGVGLGVGCRIGVGFSRFWYIFLPAFGTELHGSGTFPRRKYGGKGVEKGGRCRISLHRGRNPTPNPSPEMARIYWGFPCRV